MNRDCDIYPPLKSRARCNARHFWRTYVHTVKGTGEMNLSPGTNKFARCVSRAPNKLEIEIGATHARSSKGKGDFGATRAYNCVTLNCAVYGYEYVFVALFTRGREKASRSRERVSRRFSISPAFPREFRIFGPKHWPRFKHRAAAAAAARSWQREAVRPHRRVDHIPPLSH